MKHFRHQPPNVANVECRAYCLATMADELMEDGAGLHGGKAGMRAADKQSSTLFPFCPHFFFASFSRLSLAISYARFGQASSKNQLILASCPLHAPHYLQLEEGGSECSIMEALIPIVAIVTRCVPCHVRYLKPTKWQRVRL